MDSRTRKRVALLGLLAFTFVRGVGNGFIEDGTSLYLAYFVVCTALSEAFILWWFALDAREREFPMPVMAYVLFFAATIVMVPLYFLQTRRAQGLICILLAVGYFAALLAAYSLGLYAVGLLHVTPQMR